MSGPWPPEEIIEHYQRIEDEAARLPEGPNGTMEAIRTLELLGRHLPPPPARVLDVGGGPGFYARRLTAAGYEVHLMDPVPRHVDAASRPDGDLPAPASACLGDARALEHPDGSFDAVLLLGPLYHLTDLGERMAALGEALRVVRADGVVAAAGISRFASAIDGLDRGLVDDPVFVDLMRRDLDEGQHRNDTGNPNYFTTAYFHHPDELRAEMIAAGFGEVEVYAIEGISWAAPDLAERLADPDRRQVVLDIVRRTETEPSLLGASPHLLGIGRR
ncbi:MAG: methyltransferase domain-containing protein [Actinobacteria bacterium]|nr:methyltransferase domain-containing protein [Actinomycetota bacterium]MBU1494931.1 methyltransferase domain-containing protein [Actinomycetota bacterium]MBU1865647.1 methyltransferase domain-containing protein [Actinomycetota bacterium]